MNEFIALFGGVTIADIVFVGCAVGFLAGIFHKVSKYFKNKVLLDAKKDEEWEKVINQVNQYPKWHDQSIKIRDGLKESIDRIDKNLSDFKTETSRTNATNCRYRIIRFNDELLKHERHTKEHFDQILTDIDDYDKYCQKDKDYKNNKAMLAIDNIKKTYRKCAEESAFL